MSCRDIKPLVLAERDGGLGAGQLARIDTHVATCASCRQLRTRLAVTVAAWQTDVARVAVPDLDAEWQAVRTRLPGLGKPAQTSRRSAKLVWLAVPLAAAAALAVGYFASAPPPTVPAETAAEGATAQAEFVEAGDAKASTLVFVDKDSGWLVVWASGDDTSTKG
jgi:hypothetical protein